MSGVPEIREAREILSRTPRLLEAWLPGLSAGWLSSDEGEGTYDPVNVVGHLIFGEETDWIPRIRLILEQGEAEPFPPFDRNGFRQAYAGQPVEALVRRFAAARAESLAALEGFGLVAADLDRTGTHPAFGPVTLRQLIATWAAHDLTHVAQIARVMAKRYQDEVGPWRAYLGVMADRER